MEQKTRRGKLLLLSLAGLVTLGAVSFVVGKALAEQIEKDKEYIIPILVGGPTPENQAGQSGWFYVDRTSWGVYKKGNGVWNKIGFLYDMVEYHVIGTTLLNAEGLYNLYVNVLTQHYNYEASIQQWVEDFQKERLLSYQEYNVTFVNYDDSFVSTQKARLRETISFKGKLPSKAADNENIYSFTNWSDSLKSICEDITPKAEYLSISYGRAFRPKGNEYELVLDGSNQDKIVGLEIPSEINGKPVTSIGDDAFRGYSNLEYITLPNTIETIGQWSFYGCSSLKELVIPASVNSINDTALCWGMNSVERFVVEEGNQYFATLDDTLYTKLFDEVIRYPAGKVQNYENDQYFLKESIRKIWNFAFCGFSGINEIILNATAEEIGAWAFGGSTIEKFNFTNSVKSVSTDPFGACHNLKEFTVETGNTKFKTESGALYNITGDTLIRYPTANGETLFNIGSNVKNIGSYAFNSCSLKEIVIPNTVNEISYGAFSECHELMIVKIPSSITTINELAFIECGSLIDMFIPSTVTRIAGKAFDFMGDVVIRCQAPSKPANWDDNWCTSQPVLWSQTERK